MYTVLQLLTCLSTNSIERNLHDNYMQSYFDFVNGETIIIGDLPVLVDEQSHRPMYYSATVMGSTS